MINGVLVERTVDGVLPALQTNSDGLKKVLDELVKQYKRQQEEMEKWKVRWSPYPALISQIAFGELGCTDIWLEYLLTLVCAQKKNNIQVVQQ